MRVTAPITDYIPQSILTVLGDLAVRGIVIPERLPAGGAGTYLQGTGVGALPAYSSQLPPLTTHGDILSRNATVPVRIVTSTAGKVLQAKGAGALPEWADHFNLLTTKGDLWVRGTSVPERIAAGAAGTYFQGKGAGNLPAYESSMPPLTTKGDIIVQDTTNPARLAAVAIGKVLTAKGTTTLPAYESLFDYLTTVGDLWIRGAADPQRIAAGALDTYFKGQGAGVLPIYEKMHLKDTGRALAHITRDAAGVVEYVVGYEPSAVIFISAIDNGPSDAFSVGIGFVDNNMCGYHDVAQNAWFVNPSACLYVFHSVNSYIYAYVSAISSNSFTLTWVRGAGAFSTNTVYLALP